MENCILPVEESTAGRDVFWNWREALREAFRNYETQGALMY